MNEYLSVSMREILIYSLHKSCMRNSNPFSVSFEGALGKTTSVLDAEHIVMVVYQWSNSVFQGDDSQGDAEISIQMSVMFQFVTKMINYNL